MHQYRTHNCNELNKNNTGETVKLSGWVNRVRDHGGLLFPDLRDNYGLTQCVIDNSHSLFATVDNLSNETVITIVGKVLTRSDETINKNLPTGEIEVQIQEIEVQSVAQTLPFPVNQDSGYPEDMRLKYRFLDLRMEQMHKNILLRSNVIASLRNRMIEQGFTEFQTPILTAYHQKELGIFLFHQDYTQASFMLYHKHHNNLNNC